MKQIFKDFLPILVCLGFALFFLSIIMEWEVVTAVIVIPVVGFGIILFFRDLERAARWARRMESDERRNRSSGHGGTGRPF